MLFSYFTFSSCFELFPVEKRVVSKVNFDNGICYKAYLVETGATTKDVIQIWHINKSYEILISSYEDCDSAYLSSYGKGFLVVALYRGSQSVVKNDTINVR